MPPGEGLVCYEMLHRAKGLDRFFGMISATNEMIYVTCIKDVQHVCSRKDV